jgi:hypothetical protein
MIIGEFTAGFRILLKKGLSRYNISEDQKLSENTQKFLERIHYLSPLVHCLTKLFRLSATAAQRWKLKKKYNDGGGHALSFVSRLRPGF